MHELSGRSAFFDNFVAEHRQREQNLWQLKTKKFDEFWQKQFSSTLGQATLDEAPHLRTRTQSFQVILKKIPGGAKTLKKTLPVWKVRNCATLP